MTSCRMFISLFLFSTFSVSLPVLAQAPREQLKDSYLPAECSLGRALGKHTVREQRQQP